MNLIVLILNLFCFAITTECCNSTGHSDGPEFISSFGTDFVFVFPIFSSYISTAVENNNMTYIIITNQANEFISFTVSMLYLPDTYNNESDTLEPVDSKIVYVPGLVDVDNLIVRAMSNGSISVVVVIYFDDFGYSFTVLPIKTLGTKYRITTGNASQNNQNAFIVLPLTEYCNPTIKYTDCGGNNQTQHMIYPYVFTHTCNKDISGMTIESNFPIAVFSGIIDKTTSGLYGFDMLLPIQYWGTRFLLSNLINEATYLSSFKIVAEYDDTKIYINCTHSKDLLNGEYFNYTQCGMFSTFLYATNPVSIFRIDGAPESLNYFVQIPSLDHFLTEQSIIFDSSYALINQNGPSLKIGGTDPFLNNSLDYVVTYKNSLDPLTNVFYIKLTTNTSSKLVEPTSDTSYSIFLYGDFHNNAKYGQVSGFIFNTSSANLHTLESVCPQISTFSSTDGTQISTFSSTDGTTVCQQSSSTITVSHVVSLITSSVNSTIISRTVTTVSAFASSTTINIEDKITHVINWLAQINITTNSEVKKILHELNRTLSLANGTLTVDNFINTTVILCKCATVSNLEDSVFYLYVDCYNQVLNQKDAVFIAAQLSQNTSVYLIDCVHDMASHTVNSSLMCNLENIAMSIVETDCNSIDTGDSNNGLAFVQYSNNTVEIIEDNVVHTIAPQLTTFLILPYSALCIGASTSNSTIRNDFLIYRNQKLFVSSSFNVTEPENKCQAEEIPITYYVTSVKVLLTPDISYTNLAQPILYGFNLDNAKNLQIQKLLHAVTLCVSWYISWDRSGCRLKEIQGNIYICECNHMTDYSLLVDDSQLDPALCDNTLRILGLTLTSISSLSLFVTIVLTTLRKISLHYKLYIAHHLFQRTKNMKSVIGSTLIVTLFLFYILFIILSDQSICGLSDYNCEVSGAILYTILLSTLFFAAFSGFTIFKLYCIVFSHAYLNFYTSPIFITIISIGIPCVITTIVWFTVADFFLRNDGFCWIRPTYVNIAVVMPSTIMILGDVLLTGLLIKGFFFSGSIAIQSSKGRRKIIAKKILVLLAVQIILGLPWVLQYFTIGYPYVTAFNYLFTLANGSQGIWLTIMYLYSFFLLLGKVTQSTIRNKTIKKSKIRRKKTEFVDVNESTNYVKDGKPKLLRDYSYFNKTKSSS